jgi:hypothetical protein
MLDFPPKKQLIWCNKDKKNKQEAEFDNKNCVRVFPCVYFIIVMKLHFYFGMTQIL